MTKKTPTKKLTAEQEEELGSIHEALAEIVDGLVELGPITREFSLVLTKVEEAEMWMQRGFDVLGYEPVPEDEGDGEEDEGEDEGDEEDEDEA